MRILLSTFPFPGLMRASVFSERSATQRLPEPYAIAKGRERSVIFFTTVFVAGSIRTTRPRARSVVQIEPPAESTIPDCAPIETFATASRGGGAAEAQTASTPTAATPAQVASPYLARALCISTTLYQK